MVYLLVARVLATLQRIHQAYRLQGGTPAYAPQGFLTLDTVPDPEAQPTQIQPNSPHDAEAGAPSFGEYKTLYISAVSTER